MAKAGWYPDPGGGAGLYRYWDGRAWSASTSPNPTAPAPNQTIVGTPTAAGQPPYQAGSQGQVGSQPQPGQGSQYPGGGAPQYQAGRPVGGYGTDYRAYQQLTAPRKRHLGWWIGIGAVAVVLALVIVLVVRNVSGGGGLFGSPSDPGSEDACPSVASATPSGGTATSDGRVHGGPISYPELGSPWGAPQPDNRVPFGTDVLTQNVTIEASYAPGSSWVASVLIGELIAGDGFFSPQQGSEIVVKCIIGAFYGNATVGRADEVNKATTVDGHNAWIVRSHLTFDIPNLKTKGETMTVVIINAGETSGIFYSSIPDTSPQLQAPADEVLKELKVD